MSTIPTYECVSVFHTVKHVNGFPESFIMSVRRFAAAGEAAVRAAGAAKHGARRVGLTQCAPPGYWAEALLSLRSSCFRTGL